MEAFGLGVTEGENGNILRFVRWNTNRSGFQGLGFGERGAYFPPRNQVVMKGKFVQNVMLRSNRSNKCIYPANEIGLRILFPDPKSFIGVLLIFPTPICTTLLTCSVSHGVEP